MSVCINNHMISAAVITDQFYNIKYTMDICMTDSLEVT